MSSSRGFVVSIRQTAAGYEFNIIYYQIELFYSITLVLVSCLRAITYIVVQYMWDICDRMFGSVQMHLKVVGTVLRSTYRLCEYFHVPIKNDRTKSQQNKTNKTYE